MKLGQRKGELSATPERSQRKPDIYPCRDPRRGTVVDNLLFSISLGISDLDILWTVKRCFPKLEDRISLVRHHCRGSLTPASLLCIWEALKWRRKMDLASCGLPMKIIPHGMQYPGESGGSGVQAVRVVQTDSRSDPARQ